MDLLRFRSNRRCSVSKRNQFHLNRLTADLQSDRDAAKGERKKAVKPRRTVYRSIVRWHFGGYVLPQSLDLPILYD